MKAKQLIAFAALLLAIPACERPRSTTPARNPLGRESVAAAREVVRIGFTVSDLERESAALIELGFAAGPIRALTGPEFSTLVDLSATEARSRELRLGNERVELTEYLTPRGRTIPPDSRSNDLWFEHLAIVTSDIDVAYRRVSQHFGNDGAFAPISEGPQTIPLSNPAAGGIRAAYFKDFDGHPLELIWYPQGKGRAQWQRQDHLFLGIDHTALAVSNSDASLASYRDALGLRVRGTSLNFGPQQARLSGVADARVRITGLAADVGPGIEFLEYLAPRTSRAAPRSQANDLWHWEITLLVTDVDGAARSVVASGGQQISHSAVELPDNTGVRRRTLLVRDRDGHVLRLTSS